jgi:hypothetical protein
MDISKEEDSQTNQRLEHVIKKANFDVLEVPYTFVDTSSNEVILERLDSALAFVRDGEIWSALVPSSKDSEEKFLIFSFHFPTYLDNSGFVGWLASHLKASLGTGVLVVCGYNSNRGGIFDYWGVPYAIGDEVVEAVARLRAGS